MSDEQSVSQEDFLFGYSSWDSTNDCDQVEALKAAAECTYEVGMSEVSNKCHKCDSEFESNWSIFKLISASVSISLMDHNGIQGILLNFSKDEIQIYA